ncbi:MAG TPA: hypothetical protein VGF40_07505 [Thermoanaerobaculia bacterium]
MKSAILAIGVTLALAVPMLGDVTIRQTTTGKGLGMAASGSTTTYIKGMKMRSDTEARGNVLTTIFDVENQKMVIFDAKKKSADVWDMQAFSEEMAKSVQAGEVTASVKPNGEKKEIAGKTATGYDLETSVPATIGGEGGMAMTVTLSGPMWIVKGAPGTKDYMEFYKGAAERGWIFSDPRAAKGSPGQAKAMAEMYRLLASTGGVPYETEMTIAITGEGPMASVMARMGGMSMTSTVQSVDTGALDDALFAPPAGYKLVQKK